MRITLPWIALLQLASLDIASAVAPVLRPRDYDSREYYAIQLSSGIAPESLARYFGFEFEGRLGELDDHYLFSGPLSDTDVIEDYRRRRKSKRSLWDVGGWNEDQIIFWEKQKLKKLEKRIVPPNRRRATTLPQKRNKSLVKQLEKVARKLHIEDPIFGEQWHLVNISIRQCTSILTKYQLNTVQKGHDVNVTGVWLEGFSSYGIS
jgi:kexin